MKDPRSFSDLGMILEEVFEAARNFSGEFKKNMRQYSSNCEEKQEDSHNEQHTFDNRNFTWRFFEEGTDYYPAYSFPPMNVFLDKDRNMNFEFALAGFSEKNISLSFQGDYMVFSAKLDSPETEAENDAPAEEGRQYFKRRLKFKDIQRQKYFVPASKFDQEQVKAVYSNGILKVTVPPKAEYEASEGIKIEIQNID